MARVNAFNYPKLIEDYSKERLWINAEKSRGITYQSIYKCDLFYYCIFLSQPTQAHGLWMAKIKNSFYNFKEKMAA